MRRFRIISVWVLVLLLVVGIDPMGRAAASAAVTGQQAPTVVTNVAGAAGGCGVCGTPNHAAMPPGSCVTGICWNLQASSASTLSFELHARAPFGLGIYSIGAGIAGEPEPHP